MQLNVVSEVTVCLFGSVIRVIVLQTGEQHLI